MVLKQTTILVSLCVITIGGGWLFDQRIIALEQRLALYSVELRSMNQANQILTTQVNQLIPPGTIMSYAGPLEVNLQQQLQQSGWLLCDGSHYPIADYPHLYQAIQSTYGAAPAKTFKVPDFRGVFLRGLDLGKGEDPDHLLGSYQADANKLHAHQGETEISGLHQHPATSQAAGQHQHLLEAKGYWYTSKQKNERPAITQEVDDDQKYWTTAAGEHHHELIIGSSGDHRHSLLITADGEHESRPKNYPVIYFIKY